MPGKQQSTGTWSNKAVQRECEQTTLRTEGNQSVKYTVYLKIKKERCTHGFIQNIRKPVFSLNPVSLHLISRSYSLTSAL